MIPFMARGRHPTRIHVQKPNEQITAKYLSCWSGRDLHNAPQTFPALTSLELFGNNQPLEIDFGCGTGVLACNRAQHNPQVNILGIDLSQKPLYCALSEATKLGLENIKFIRGNFTLMLPLFKPDSLSAAYYLMPNPPGDYHDERANEHRRCFLQGIYNALVPGGHFYFATDAIEFFECIRIIVKSSLRYEMLGIENIDIDFRTRYWRIWEEHGRQVSSFGVEK